MFTPPSIKPTCFARKQNEKQHRNLPNDRIHHHKFKALRAHNGANGAQGSKLLYSWMNTSLIHWNLHMQIQPAQQSFRVRSLLARRTAGGMELSFRSLSPCWPCSLSHSVGLSRDGPRDFYHFDRVNYAPKFAHSSFSHNAPCLGRLRLGAVN